MLFDITSQQFRQPGDCRIFIGGQEYDEFYPYITSVDIDTSRLEAAVASLTFSITRDEWGNWAVIDSGVFRQWESVRINAVFRDDEEEVFRGFIRNVNAEYPVDQGSAELVVQCQDESFSFDRERKEKVWGIETGSITDKDIIQQIVLQESSKSSFPSVLQTDQDNHEGRTHTALNQNDTDIKLLKEIADANSFELIFMDGEVYFGPPRLSSANMLKPIMVYAGDSTNCTRISVQTDAHNPDEVSFSLPAEGGAEVLQETVRSNLDSLGTTSVNQQSGLGTFCWNMPVAAGTSRDRLHHQAQQKANEADLNRVVAEGELDTIAYSGVMKPGSLVPVDGLGEQNNGLYYVDSVQHKFTSNGYQQLFRLLRNALGDNLSELPLRQFLQESKR